MPSESWFDDPAAAQLAMVEHQLRGRGIRSERVLAAIGRVPRERFVPAVAADSAYADSALPIDCSQTISQPIIVAMMTDALQLSGNEKVLEIGTGSGYPTRDWMRENFGAYDPGTGGVGGENRPPGGKGFNDARTALGGGSLINDPDIFEFIRPDGTIATISNQ